MKRPISLLIHCFLFLVVFLLIGVSLLFLVYNIPTTGRIADHISQSIEQFSKEGDYPNWSNERYLSTRIDGYTDQLMISIAGYEFAEKPYKEMMLNHYIQSKTSDLALKVTVHEKPMLDGKLITYGRYWHGYLIFLKPFLWLFDVAAIRIMNMIMVLAIFALFTYECGQRLGKKYQAAAFCTIIVLNPITVMLCFSFVSDAVIAFGISSLILAEYHRMHGERLIYMYLLSGASCAFLDLLTYPLLTLTVPLIITCLLDLHFRHDSLRLQIKRYVVFILAWGVAYAFIWSSKWILANLITGQNILSDAINEMRIRMYSANGGLRISVLRTWYNNICVIVKWPYIILIGIMILAICVCGFRRYRTVKDIGAVQHAEFRNAVPLLLIAVLPFTWYAFTKNHSYIHVMFTYRILAGSVFAVLSAITVVIDGCASADSTARYETPGLE